MRYEEMYGILEKEFQNSFVEELVPGIVHNFANPLNGIMGRSKLLQRKLVDFIKRADLEKDASWEENNRKLVRDVDSISREADRLSVLLQTVMGKFCAVGDRTVQKVNLSELLENEMRFFDFYLDFKHTVKKTVQFDKELPDVKGTPADYSLALSTLIRYAAAAMKECPSRELIIATQYDGEQVCVKMESRGEGVSAYLKKLLPSDVKGDLLSLETMGEVEDVLLCAFSLLRKWEATIDIKTGDALSTVNILVPVYKGTHQSGD